MKVESTTDKKPIMSEAGRPQQVRSPTATHRGNDEELIKAGREFLRIEGNAEQPWFLYLHLMDIHEYTYDEASASEMLSAAVARARRS